MFFPRQEEEFLRKLQCYLQGTVNGITCMPFIADP